MRIAYDHQIFAGQVWGGVSRYFFEIATRIREYPGCEVSILSPFYINNYVERDPALNIWGRHFHRLPRPRRWTQGLNGQLVGWKLRHDAPDVLHETYYGNRRLASAKTKVVVTIHDMIHEKFPQYFPADDPTAKWKKAAVERADHLICISENTRQDLIDILRVERNRTSVIHQAYSLKPRNGAATPPILERPYVTYVGGRGGYKNFAGLLGAFRASPFLRDSFAIVCFGGGAFSTEDREAIAKAGLTPERAVQIQGDDDVLAALYRGAAALVYPSHYEGFGLPPLEAMSVQCPVVTSNTSSMPEVCGAAAEYFDPAQPESIAAAIERVVGDSSLRRQLVERGLEQIRKYSWDRCAQQTATIYMEAK